MAIIRSNEILKMKSEELNKRFNDMKKELMKLQSQVAIGTMPENPGKISEIKRTIARIYTMKNIQKKLEGGKKTKDELRL